MVSRRSVLGFATGAAPLLAGCSRRSRDVIHVRPVDTVTLEGRRVAELPSIPAALSVAIANVLRRNAVDGVWRLDGDPEEGGKLATALEDRPTVVTRGQQYHLDGIYATFRYDAEQDEVRATAVFPCDAPGTESAPRPHVFERDELPEEIATAVDAAIEQGTHAEVGDVHEVSETAYDGTYVRVDGEVYRTSVESMA